MADIDNILAAISYIYRTRKEDQVEIPLAARSRLLLSFANQYKQAATVLDETSPQLFLVYVQMIGHSLELAMKSCLAAAGVEPPRGRDGHDLVDLYRRIQSLGFNLPDGDLATLVHLHHLYSSDLATGTRYKSRYPTDRDEWVGGTIPGNDKVVRIVESLCRQAREYCDS